MITMRKLWQITSALHNCTMLAHLQGQAYVLDTHYNTVGYLDMVDAVIVLRKTYAHVDSVSTLLREKGIAFEVADMEDAVKLYPSLGQLKKAKRESTP